MELGLYAQTELIVGELIKMSKPRFTNLRTNAPKPSDRVFHFEKHAKAYYAFQYYNPKDPKCDELGYVHFRSQKEMDKYIEVCQNPVPSLAMSKWDYRLFLLSCMFWTSVALLGMAVLIMYLVQGVL